MGSETFGELVARGSPRLTINYETGPAGQACFDWDVQGRIPTMQLLGEIVSVQAKIVARAWDDSNRFDRHGLVIVMDGTDSNAYEFRWFWNPLTPMRSLLAMLELIKQTLVNATMMQQQAAQQQAPNKPVIFGPDGNPFGDGGRRFRGV